MKRLLSILLIAVSAFLAISCTSNAPQGEKIPYERADNYFFSNDAPDSENPIICRTQEELEQYFGYAAVMGEGGQPTKIDFSKQIALGIVLPVTNHETEIRPTDLLLDGEVLTLHYKIDAAEQDLSFTIRPMILLIIDKEYADKATSITIKQD